MDDAEGPLTIEEMMELVQGMYEAFCASYPDYVERDYDNAIQYTRIKLRTDYGVDLNDPKVFAICVRFYAALCVLSAGATDDGLDDWLGVTMLGAALGVPTDD